jgi:hypothetical protein
MPYVVEPFPFESSFIVSVVDLFSFDDHVVKRIRLVIPTDFVLNEVLEASVVLSAQCCVSLIQLSREPLELRCVRSC